MLIQATCDTRYGRCGDEDRGKDERDRDHGATHLLHRLLSSGFRIHPLVDMVLNRFNHDNGVVDDEADGQHKPEQ